MVSLEFCVREAPIPFCGTFLPIACRPLVRYSSWVFRHMFAQLVVYLSLPLASWGARSRSTGYEDGISFTLPPAAGLPKLDVHYTADIQVAASIIGEWSNERHFGMRAVRRKVGNGTQKVFCTELLAISSGHRVLLFDLRPLACSVPRHLPEVLDEFLENSKNTFYGFGLAGSVARMAFEFDCVIRCVDFHARAWPELKRGGNAYELANSLLGTKLDANPPGSWSQRPITLWQLVLMAEYAYLQWALADYFLREHGRVQKSWHITMAEMYGLGTRSMLMPEARHNWTQPSLDWKKQEQQFIENQKSRRQDSGASAPIQKKPSEVLMQGRSRTDIVRYPEQ